MTKILSYAVVAGFTFVTGCASIPQRSPGEHNQALLGLVRAGASDETLKKYFDAYAEKRGCYGARGCDREKEIVIEFYDYFGGKGDAAVSFTKFLENVRSGEAQVKQQLEACIASTSCLADIRVLENPAHGMRTPMCAKATRSHRHASGQRESHGAERVPGCSVEDAANSTLLVHDSERAGEGAWISDALREEFLANFKAAAAKSNLEAQGAIQQEKVKQSALRAEEDKITKKLQARKCERLYGEAIQRVSPHLYTVHLIAAGMSRYAGSYGGEVYALFKTNRVLPTNAGLPGIAAQFVGTKQVTTALGATEDRDIYQESKECNDLYHEQAPAH